MTSPIDRILGLWISLAAVGLTALVSVPVGITWLIGDLLPHGIDTDWQPELEEANQETETEFNIAAFDVTLWHAPPAPPAEIAGSGLRLAEPATVAPPRLSLIGILTESAAGGGTTLKAVLYDPEADELVFAAVGHPIGDFRVSGVTQDAVRIAYGERVFRMPLDGQAGWEQP